MAARMLLATFPSSRLLDIQVLDPAVGTGGFLVSLMNIWQKHIYQIELNRFNEDIDRAIDGTKRRLQDIASRNLFGIDFNPILVRAAQMNLVMHCEMVLQMYSKPILSFHSANGRISLQTTQGQALGPVALMRSLLTHRLDLTFQLMILTY